MGGIRSEQQTYANCEQDQWFMRTHTAEDCLECGVNCQLETPARRLSGVCDRKVTCELDLTCLMLLRRMGRRPMQRNGSMRAVTIDEFDDVASQDREIKSCGTLYRCGCMRQADKIKPASHSMDRLLSGHTPSGNLHTKFG